MARQGVCSNFLCDAKPGDALTITGPTGKVMLMPEVDPTAEDHLEALKLVFDRFWHAKMSAVKPMVFV